MKCLRSMCGRDRVRNEEVRRRVRIQETLSERMDKARGVRVRGRPKMAWMDGVKRAVEKRGVNVDRAKKLACDINEWRALVK